MFVAIQKQKTGVDLPEKDSEGNIINVTPEYKEHKAFIATTREELENNEFIIYDRIDEYDFAEMYNGVIYVDPAELQIAKEIAIRAVRNQYLVKYVDGVASNPLRWAEMSAEKQAQIADYRRYLLDYTIVDNWYKQNPLMFEEWLERIKELEKVLTKTEESAIIE